MCVCECVCEYNTLHVSVCVSVYECVCVCECVYYSGCVSLTTKASVTLRLI